ncbi:MAG TPA: hypothetical protein VF486_16035 [Actinomycetes bacterium]
MVVTPAGRSAGLRWWPAGLAWALWALAILGLLVTAWLDHLLRQAGRPDLAQETALDVPEVLVVLSGTTVGAVLASRRRDHPVGWLLLALGLLMASLTVAQAYADYGFRARPGALPAARFVALYGPATLGAMLGCVGFVLLLTPTGSLPSPRWRWWARVMVAAPVVSLVATLLLPNSLNSDYQTLDNPLALRAFGGALLAALWVALGITVLAVLVAAGSLVVRFRRAHGVERQQLRWVALAAAVVAPAALVLLAAAASTTLLAAAASTTLWSLFNWALVVCVTVLPLAIGAAILRYRLYDLDRIVSRTLAYALLTVLLGGGYAGLVLGLGQLAGRGSSLAVAGATLAVAGLFQPARRRVQQAVDRRFNRRRYDAARTIEGFSARLRQQVDLDTLTTELLAVVEQTMQPTQASLWLRPSASAFPDQRSTGAPRAASQPTPASRSVHAAL